MAGEEAIDNEKWVAKKQWTRKHGGLSRTRRPKVRVEMTWMLMTFLFFEAAMKMWLLFLWVSLAALRHDIPSMVSMLVFYQFPSASIVKAWSMSHGNLSLVRHSLASQISEALLGSRPVYPTCTLIACPTALSSESTPSSIPITAF
jgi:hypothetical protein